MKVLRRCTTTPSPIKPPDFGEVSVGASSTEAAGASSTEAAGASSTEAAGVSSGRNRTWRSKKPVSARAERWRNPKQNTEEVRAAQSLGGQQNGKGRRRGS